MNASDLNLSMIAAADVTPDAIEAAIATAVQAKPGESSAARFTLEALVRQCPDKPETRKAIAERLAKALESDASVEAKLLLCRQLWFLGPAVAGPALSRMLLDDTQADLACYAIARDPGFDAGQLLRDALPKASGSARVAIINLLGEKRDERAVASIGGLVANEDPACADAAAAALGKIGNGAAADALTAAHGASEGRRKLALAHALLACAEGLLNRGDTDHARSLYAALTGQNEAPVIQKAAQGGLASVETCGWRRLFDGKTFTGWEGNMDWFRIEDGAIVAGSFDKGAPNNEFLCSTNEYGDFELRLQVKLLGDGANAGIQIRSRRVPNHYEVSGYQADMGQNYWGGLYDESRRNTMLAAPDPEVMAKMLNPDDWNDYTIRCAGRRVQLWMNGHQTVDYTEPDGAIAATGIIGLQIHSGAPSEAWYRHIMLRPAGAAP